MLIVLFVTRWAHDLRFSGHYALPRRDTSRESAIAGRSCGTSQGARDCRDHLLWHSATAESPCAEYHGKGKEHGVG